MSAAPLSWFGSGPRVLAVGLLQLLLPPGLIGQASGEWVVKRVVPAPPDSIHGSAWGYYYLESSAGDVDRDGLIDCFLAGQYQFPVMGLQTFGDALVRGGAMSDLLGASVFHVGNLGPWPDARPVGLFCGSAILEARAFTRYPLPDALAILDLQSGQILHTLDPPSDLGPPHHVPQIGWTALHPAGDINGDGCDDVAYADYGYLGVQSGVVGVVGTVDGGTGSLLWTRYLERFLFDLPRITVSPFAEGSPDIDLDGYPDIACRTSQTWSSGLRHYLRMLSGADGSTIWERAVWGGYQTSTSTLQFVSDLTHDGVLDLVFSHTGWASYGNPNFLLALDGRTGATVWETDLALLDPYLSLQPPRMSLSFVRVIGSGADEDGDSIADVAVSCQENDVTGSHIGRDLGLWFFSGADGSVVGHKTAPRDLKPFSSSFALTNSDHRVGVGIGDVDGDGFLESGASVTSSTGESYAVFYGEPTLFVPAKIRIADTANFSLRIPRGANSPFQILLSTKVDIAGGGEKVDGWDTYLVRDYLMRASSSNSLLQGVLDSAGEATGSIPIPLDSRLLGVDVFAMAVVFDAGGSGSVVTVSSLGKTHILP